jgi:WD40 repeat protein
MEATFTCVRAISETRAVMCAERGAVCILDDGEPTQKLYKVFNVDFGVRCLAIDLSTEQLWVAGSGIDIRLFRFADLVQPRDLSRQHRSASNSTDSTVSLTDTSLGPVALGCVSNNLVAIDGTRSIRVYSRVGEEVRWAESSIANDARSHGCAVLGVGLLPMPNPPHAKFFTWSSDGTIIFWSKDGFNKGSMDVPLEQPQFDEDAELNELAVVRASDDGNFFAAGDKSGVLRYVP